MSIDWKTFGADGEADWDALEREFPYAAEMAACVQDPVFHAERDVWTHTRLVMNSLVSDPDFRALAPARRTVMALAVMWHDVAKPETRTELFDEELGRTRVSHPHHAARGALRSWRDLWRAGVPVGTRLDVFAHVMGHQQVFRVMDQADPKLSLARLSTLGSVYELTMLGRADNRGRICPEADHRAAQEAMQLTRWLAEENGALHGPWPFPSEAARLRFSRGDSDGLFYEPQKPKGSRVILLSGLPGTGKDTYIRSALKDHEHISLDLTRERMHVDPREDQGRVAQATIEACRVALRAKKPFVFNATNLTRLQRSKWISLALSYDARVEIRAMEVPERTLRRNNRERQAAVPDAAIDRMIEKWEPPTPLEAHAVTWIGEDFRPIPLSRRIETNEPGTMAPAP